MQRRDVGALDQAKRHHAKRRQDVVLQRAPVDACGVRIAVLCDVGAHVALGEVGDGGAGLGQERARFLAPLDAVDDLGCALACLGGGDLAVGAERDAAWRATRPALDDVDLAPRGVDAHAEARQLAVPDDDVALGDRERVHRPASQSVSVLRRGIPVTSQRTTPRKRQARRHHFATDRNHCPGAHARVRWRPRRGRQLASSKTDVIGMGYRCPARLGGFTRAARVSGFQFRDASHEASSLT